MGLARRLVFAPLLYLVEAAGLGALTGRGSTSPYVYRCPNKQMVCSVVRVHFVCSVVTRYDTNPVTRNRALCDL